MTRVKVIQLAGNSAAVEWDNNGKLQAVIIQSRHVSAVVQGIAYVPIEVLLSGTQYGLEWSVVLSDKYPIKPADLQGALRSAGIWTVDDLIARPNDVLRVIRSFSNGIYADLMTQVKLAMQE